MILYQSYIQWQHHFSTSVTTVAGLHHQATDLNPETAIEPRLALRWTIHPKHSVNAGVGLHSQMQQQKIYFGQILIDTFAFTYVQTNRNL